MDNKLWKYYHYTNNKYNLRASSLPVRSPSRKDTGVNWTSEKRKFTTPTYSSYKFYVFAVDLLIFLIIFTRSLILSESLALFIHYLQFFSTYCSDRLFFKLSPMLSFDPLHTLFDNLSWIVTPARICKAFLPSVIHTHSTNRC